MAVRRPDCERGKAERKDQWKTGIEGSRVSGKGYYHAARKQIVEIEAMPLELEVAASGKPGGGVAFYATVNRKKIFAPVIQLQILRMQAEIRAQSQTSRLFNDGAVN
jgi:hypothetical protein